MNKAQTDDYIKSQAKQILWCIETFGRTIAPWKKRLGTEPKGITQEYCNGWNDCLNEIKKNRKKGLAWLEENTEKWMQVKIEKIN